MMLQQAHIHLAKKNQEASERLRQEQQESKAEVISWRENHAQERECLMKETGSEQEMGNQMKGLEVKLSKHKAAPKENERHQRDRRLNLERE